MKLSAVTRGRRRAPDRQLVIGTEGIGKSTYGASAPSSIFIAAEEGIGHLDVASFPEPQTFEDVVDAVRELKRTDHEFRTLVIDTLDWLEPLVFAKVCRDNGWANIETPGYGKGYVVAADTWRALLGELDELRAAKGMEVILLAHALIKPFQNPAGHDFSRYECALNKASAALVKQWTDVNLFATYEDFTTDPKKGRVKGISTGKRVMHTERTAAWDAKNRYGLPPTLPFSYADYAAARERGFQAEPTELVTACEDLMAKLEYSADHDARAYITENKNNPANLVLALNRLRVEVSEAGLTE